MSKMKKTSMLCTLVLLSSQMLIPSVTSAETLSGTKTITKSATKVSGTPSVINDSSDIDSDIDSGTWGTVPWRIDSKGTLSFEGGRGVDNDSKESPWSIYHHQIKKIVFNSKVIAPQNSSFLFSGLKTVTKIQNLDNLDTSNVTSMSNMFRDMSSLTSLNLSSFDTSNVVDMSAMFWGCNSLTELDVSSFNTSKVKSMNGMFYNASSLTKLDVSSFDTSNVIDMGNMFYNVSSLTKLDVSSFDTSNVRTMINMFADMSSLTSLDISSFDTKLAENISMFYGCKSIYNLKLGEKTVLHYRSSLYNTNWINKSNTWKGNTDDLLIRSEEGVVDTYINEAAPEGLPVTVKYVDESGKTIHDSQSLTGKVGVDYDASSDKYKLSIDGYSLDTSKLPTNATGNFSNQAQTVTYVYKANPLPITTQSIYRLYNPNTGEHLYTASADEYDKVAKAGWKKEGVSWNAPVEGQAVYRLYNPNTGEHFYTASADEYDKVAKAGWRKEGIVFYSDTSKSLPIYRLFNPNSTGPGSHFYTASFDEYNSVEKAGWRKEGISFYGVN